jgi:putative ABC transport system ATP-binding protein
LTNPQGAEHDLLELQDHLVNKNMRRDEADHREVIIKMENIQKTYLLGIEGVTAVRGVDLQVRRGEFLLILGTSGGGKSSLLNVMGTIDTPSRGNLKLFGEYMRASTKDSEYAKIRLEKIGFVFQSFNLIGTMTATENVELPMLLNGRLKRDEIRTRAQNLLKEVGLEKRLGHYPNMMSGGEQQRVTIARALSNNPELLLMDEPTGDLDTKNADIVVNILVDLNQKNNISMVMVTHDEYMKQYAHRVVHVMDGKISKEERIDPRVNEEAYRKIRATVQGYREGEGGVIGVREGARPNGELVGITETRTLNQYPFVKFMMEQVQQKKKAHTIHN